jgi:hypothetical protein
VIVGNVFADAFRSLFDWFICLLKTAGIALLNLLIDGLVALIGLVVGLLPAMPTLPDVPADVTAGFRAGNYFFPFGFLLVVGATVAGLWLSWFVLSAGLRWAKAVG